MKRVLLAFTLLLQLSFAATPEQIEQYLSVSNSEEEMLALESQFSAMQNSFSKDKNAAERQTYDMQLLMVRFKEHLEKSLSEDEMAEILENYRNVVLLQFVSATSQTQGYDANETENYMASLKQSPDASERMKLVKEISNKFYSKEALLIMFDDLMKPLMQNGIGGGKMTKEMLKGSRENYVKMMTEASKVETLYETKDFTLEELEELLKIAKTPAIDHEVKAVYGAMAYALKDFFMSLASRYDVSKHSIDKNNTK